MILVTGANGFVGRAVCAELLRSGIPVRAAVRTSRQAAGLGCDAVAVGDITQAQWAPALEGVESIVHLAARVHVMRETAGDALSAFRALNVAATEALAAEAVRAGVKRLVYVSSIKVNGESTTERPFASDDLPQPGDPYGVSKWEAEQTLRTAALSTGLEVVVVRPPLVYGPGVGGNFLRLLRLVRRGIPIPLGAVSNRRSMIYSGNLADALVACAVHPNAADNTYLVSDGDDLSTRELVRQLARVMGASARLWPVPAGILRVAAGLTGRTAELDRMIGSLAIDASAIQSDLQWTPRYTVREGLHETAAWFTSSAQ